MFSFERLGLVQWAMILGILCGQLAGWPGAAHRGAGSNWTRPFTPDEQTVVLYHFDEGEGNEAHDSMGDPELTLRANTQALWGRRAGFGATARFERREDDANLLIGPTNNDKLHLRPCTQAWTIEAWVRYTGEGGKDGGGTYANICGTEDEGFGLPVGMRGGWNFSLHSGPRRGPLNSGIGPCARFMGSPRGKDPNHDTSGRLSPGYRGGGFTGAEPAQITDSQWHHVAWQYSYAEDLHQLFLDGTLIWRMTSPDGRTLVNNRQHEAQFSVITRLTGYAKYGGGFNYLGFGNFFGQIGEIRISKVRRY